MAYKIDVYENKKIASLFYVSCKNHTENRVAEHAGLELLFNVSTPFSYRLRGHEEDIKPGQVFIYNGREQHIEILTKDSFTYNSIIISETYLNQFLLPFGFVFNSLEFDNFHLLLNPNIKTYLNYLSILSQLNVNEHSFIFELIICALSIELLESQRNNKKQWIQKAKYLGKFLSPQQKVKKLIIDNTDNQFSLDALSRETAISKYHLVKIFKDSEGNSPIEFRNLVKIDLAKLLLRTSKKKIIDVAMDLGFVNLTTFNHLFKKLVGSSPREYRQAG
ncbi:MAG: helix-turn-helix transcriptional regulator [Bdellovibrionales bacterium]|nr:helix-turn-helix transcriptional regulator [Bdellovibrionales bacterium]